MKKLLSVILVCSILLLMYIPTLAATKVYDHTGDIPDGDPAKFYAYPIAQNATRYSPWFVQWARQKQAEYDTGRRAGDGNQMIMELSVSPVNPDHIMLGSDMAGIWRSTDGGINWETEGENNNNWCVNDIVWSPFDENVAFAVQTGTRTLSSAVSKASNSSLDGLYKTTDAGKTWKLVLPKNFISMACTDGAVQYDKNGNVLALSSEGLFKSTDDGETWEFIDNSFLKENAAVFSMHLFNGESKKMLACVEGGLYYTSNGGLLWKNLNSNVEGVTMCTSVTVDPYDENHWFACFQGPKHKLYETYDSGKTWEQVYYRINSSGLATPQVIRYVIKDDGTTRLFLIYTQCGNPIQYTDDEGENWVVPKLIDREMVYNQQGMGYFCEGFDVDPSNPGTMYYSFADTVYKSTDYGETFDYRNSGYSAINTNKVVFDQEGRVWFADVDRGLAHTNFPYKKGEYSTVERDLMATASTAVAIDPKNVNHVLSFCGGLNETFDRGENWTKVEGFSGDYIVLQYHNKDVNFIYAGNKYSTDNGETWKDLEYAVTTVSPANNDVVYSYSGGIIRKSKDRGISWEDVKNIGTSAYVVIADVADEDTVWYAGYSGIVTKLTGSDTTTFGKANGLYTDKGELVSINTMAQNPKNKNHLVAGGKETKCGLKTPGIYETLDGGKTWVLVPGMKGIAHINSLTFSPVSEEIFIGTCSNGLIVYDYNVFYKWYNGQLNSWDFSDEYIIPNMYTDGRIRVKIDSDVIGFDSEPFLENDRTFVPMRKIFEKLGATIDWDDATQTVTGTKGDTVVKLTIGNPVATVNGNEVTLDAVPQLKNSRTMIPLRFVAEALGCKVNWSDSNNLVIIKSK